jgi:hypothetical protein
MRVGRIELGALLSAMGSDAYGEDDTTADRRDTCERSILVASTDFEPGGPWLGN